MAKIKWPRVVVSDERHKQLKCEAAEKGVTIAVLVETRLQKTDKK